MKSDSERKALFACKLPDGSERKEIESTGFFVSGLHYYHHAVAQQPNGQWEAFDETPVLTSSGWVSYGDRPDVLKVEGVFSLSWEKSLCIHERYEVALKRVRKTINVSGMS